MWLEDIERTIAEINDILPEPRNFFEFEKDIRTKRAIEQNIEIIDKSISRVLKVEPSIEISDSRKIIDTRNRIIRGCDSVSNNLIWMIVVRYLPALDKEIKATRKES